MPGSNGLPSIATESLASIDVFVTNILARSCTTGAILELALRYIGLLRAKVLEAQAYDKGTVSDIQSAGKHDTYSTAFLSR